MKYLTGKQLKVSIHFIKVQHKLTSVVNVDKPESMLKHWKSA